MQSRQFGSSPYLQAGDYTSDADVYGFAARYSLSTTQLSFTLTPEANSRLAFNGTHQFRVALTPPQYTNYNGRWQLPSLVSEH